MTTMLSRSVRAIATRHSFVGKPLHHNDTVRMQFNSMIRRHKTTSVTALEATHREVTHQQSEEEIVTTTLKEIPMVPYLGSFVPFYSNVPPLKQEKILEFWPEVRRRHGDFIKIGMPGFGKGIYGETYLLNDPNEMMKVLRQEKTSRLPYPRGGITTIWSLIKHLQQTKTILATGNKEGGTMTFDENGFFGRGETWKRIRLFLQTDLLSPQAARGYVPGMVQAAQIASKSAPVSSSNLNTYINRCAFDMFNSLMFGELTKTADLNAAEKINVQYCNDAVEALTKMTKINMSLYESLIGRLLGIETPEYKSMSAAFTRIFDTSESKYQSFRVRYENEPDQLTEIEKHSYLARAIERQKETMNISEDDLIEIIKLMLAAAVDTTSSPMSWNLYHIAINQDVQDKLYNELSNAVKEEPNGCITEHVLKRSTCPYLHAVIRESHRLTPGTQVMGKENSLSDVDIHGTIVPKDSVFLFDSYSLGLDPEFVDGDPMEFKPERWLDDAVEARKGTKSEILDHPFLKDPFSQGSRKCPGSRIANNEVAILLSQLVLDWKITAPSHIKSVKDMEYTMAGLVIPELPEMTFATRS